MHKTRDWLRGNHILVNDDWLGACVEWIQEENQGRGLTDEDMNAQVYEQWLLADLHELETRCLPTEVANSQKYEFTGAYALQIDSIVDVGVSFYSQQQKLKGTENANAQVNADEPTQKPWEPKPSRMLMFKLTDGMYNVQGMEYRPISCLSPQTSPGAKILVHGNILCRHGVLLLSDSNVRFLGGEVDTLVEANTILSTLQSAMEASEEHSGKDHKQTYAGTQVRRNKAVSGTEGNQGTQRQSLGNSSTIQRGGQPSQMRRTNVKQEVKVEPISQITSVRNNVVNEDLADYEAFLDDDMDDDMDEILQEMDTEEFQSRPSDNMPSGNSNRALTDKNINNRNVTHSINPSMPLKCTAIKTSASQKTCDTSRKNPTKMSDNHARHASLKSAGHSDIQNIDDFDSIDFDDDMDFQQMDDDFMTASTTHNAINVFRSDSTNHGIGNKTQKVVSHRGGNSSIAVSKRDNLNNTNFPVSNYRKQGSHSGVPASLKSTDSSVPVNNPPSLISKDVTIDISNKGVNISISKTKSDLTRTSASMSMDENNAKPKLSLSKVKNEISGKSASSSTQKQNIQQSSIQNFFTPSKQVKVEHQDPQREISSADIQMEYPFTYLAKVMSEPAQDQPSYHTVKAYISTLTSRLTSVDEKWSLTCKINDGTMAVDVDLSNRVLTQMIGFSPREAQEMKLRIKTDPGLKEVIKEGIQQCQQKLIELVGLLELEICARNPRPVIVATKQLTSHHIDLLYNRVVASWNKGK